MSRSGYDDDCGGWDLIRWRGAVTSALRGKRGQAFLREMLVAFDALPEKRLEDGVLVCNDGVCAMGTVAQARGMDLRGVDKDANAVDVAPLLGIAGALAQEIAYENDEHTHWDGDKLRDETPEERFVRMHSWVVKQIKGGRDGDD